MSLFVLNEFIETLGAIHGWASGKYDKGFTKGRKYVGAPGKTRGIYGKEFGVKEGAECGIRAGVSLGNPCSNANNINGIGINQWKDSDASFIGDGEDPRTSKVNIPAILAARTAGGSPDPKITNNGINKRGGFRLKALYSQDDNGW